MSHPCGKLIIVDTAAAEGATQGAFFWILSGASGDLSSLFPFSSGSWTGSPHPNPNLLPYPNYLSQPSLPTLTILPHLKRR